MVELRTMRRMRGLSLVELMIGMTLGLLLLAGITSAFVSTGQLGRTQDNLSRLQESARSAFSLMTRDFREAGINDCGHFQSNANLTNVLIGSAADPMLDWNTNGQIMGFDEGVASPGVVTGAAVGQRVGTEDAVHLMSGGNVDAVVAAHNSAGTITLASANANFQPGDLAILCNFGMAALFQISNVPGPTTVTYAVGGAAPGNCAIGFGRSLRPCVTGTIVSFPSNSSLLPFKSVIWYIGNNGRPATGGSSLFRMRLVNNGGGVVPVAEEIVEGVSGMQLRYLERGAANYVQATAVANWSRVSAIEINLTMTGTEQEPTAAGGLARVQRSFFNVVALRNWVG